MNKSTGKLLSWCTLPILGLVITACYLLGATWLLFDRVEQLKSMPLNEIGDFLAGIFGALAFFWLVIGYFMQNSELKLNRNALERQIVEFEKTVSSQMEYHKLIKEKEENEYIEKSFRAKPILEISCLSLVRCLDARREIFTNKDANYDEVRFTLSNFGGDIFNIKVEVSFEDEKISHTYPNLPKNEKIPINIQNNHFPEQTVFAIYFDNNMGVMEENKYFVDINVSDFDPPEEVQLGEGHYETSIPLKQCRLI